MLDTAFVLSAGFGKRFRPQTHFMAKPALPFFNLPQALYPAALLKSVGVKNFYYNTHHLPESLELALSPYFKNPHFFEKEILDSAGGIANAKPALQSCENFWVINGDSLTTSPDPNTLLDALHFHQKTNSLVTLLGIPQQDKVRSGLCFDHEQRLTQISEDPKALHFIGFYIFNKEIFNFIEPQKTHIFSDVLLKLKNQRVSVFNLETSVSWYESGNEKDYIAAAKIEAQKIKTQKEKSPICQCFKSWGLPFEEELELFLSRHIWRKALPERPPLLQQDEFLSLPMSSGGDLRGLKNCILSDNLNLPPGLSLEESVLVDPTQWA